MSMLENASLLSYLDVVLTNEDVVHAKPDPEIYLRACELLGLSPVEVLVVEDNVNGIRAAKAAGCSVIEVRDPSYVRWPLIKDRLSL
jgi:HAD superfamily hydrolase (TIGR01509 family)